MHGHFALMCVLLATLRAAFGQPADCPVEPSPSGATMPLLLDLQGMPGVPRGLGGYVGVDVPTAPPGMACTDSGPGNSQSPGSSGGVLAGPPGDVLAGPPGDVLGGPPARDLLRGSAPRVEIETR